MSNKEDGCFAALLSIIIGIPLSAALYSEAAMLNWNWFATTVGAPRIGFLQAYGLSLVLSSFTGSPSKRKKDDRSVTEIAIEMAAHTITRFAVFAGVGYLVHLWMVG